MTERIERRDASTGLVVVADGPITHVGRRPGTSPERRTARTAHQRAAFNRYDHGTLSPPQRMQRRSGRGRDWLRGEIVGLSWRSWSGSGLEGVAPAR
jgi:hypothetical protein